MREENQGPFLIFSIVAIVFGGLICYSLFRPTPEERFKNCLNETHLVDSLIVHLEKNASKLSNGKYINKKDITPKLNELLEEIFPDMKLDF